MPPVAEQISIQSTLTERIEEIKQQTQYMQKRLTEARRIEQNFQQDLTNLRHKSDEASYVSTSQPSPGNTKKYNNCKLAVAEHIADFEQAKLDTATLPKRIKDALRTRQALGAEKQSSIQRLAVEKFGDKRDEADEDARKAIAHAVALRYCCNSTTNTDHAVNKLFQDCIHNDKFRVQMMSEIDSLTASLNVDEL